MNTYKWTIYDPILWLFMAFGTYFALFFIFHEKNPSLVHEFKQNIVYISRENTSHFHISRDKIHQITELVLKQAAKKYEQNFGLIFDVIFFHFCDRFRHSKRKFIARPEFSFFSLVQISHKFCFETGQSFQNSPFWIQTKRILVLFFSGTSHFFSWLLLSTLSSHGNHIEVHSVSNLNILAKLIQRVVTKSFTTIEFPTNCLF